MCQIKALDFDKNICSKPKPVLVLRFHDCVTIQWKPDLSAVISYEDFGIYGKEIYNSGSKKMELAEFSTMKASFWHSANIQIKCLYHKMQKSPLKEKQSNSFCL